MLHTFVEIKVCADNPDNVISKAFMEMERVNSLLNNYDNESEVSKINSFSGIMYVPSSNATSKVGSLR